MAQNQCGAPRRRRHERVDGADRKQPNSDALLKKKMRERAKLTGPQLAKLMSRECGKRRSKGWVANQESPKHAPKSADLKLYDKVFGVPDAMIRFISLASANYRERAKPKKRAELVSMFHAIALIRTHILNADDTLRDLPHASRAEAQQEWLMEKWLDFCEECGLGMKPKLSPDV